MTSLNNSNKHPDSVNLPAAAPSVCVIDIEDSSDSDKDTRINQNSYTTTRNIESPKPNIHKRRKHDLEKAHRPSTIGSPSGQLSPNKKQKLFSQTTALLRGSFGPAISLQKHSRDNSSSVICISSDEDEEPPTRSRASSSSSSGFVSTSVSSKVFKVEPISPKKKVEQQRPNKPRRFGSSKSSENLKNLKDTKENSSNNAEIPGGLKGKENTPDGQMLGELYNQKHNGLNEKLVGQSDSIPDNPIDLSEPKSDQILGEIDGLDGESDKIPNIQIKLLLETNKDISGPMSRANSASLPMLFEEMNDPTNMSTSGPNINLPITETMEMAIISSDEDSDYETNNLHGGLLEIPRIPRRRSIRDIDFVELMNKSYHNSRNQPLAYQSEIESHFKRKTLITSGYRRPLIQQPEEFTEQEMEIIFSCVAKATRNLETVDWESVAEEVYESTDCESMPTPSSCLQAFEYAIAQYKESPKKSMAAPITLHSKVSLVNALRRREYGLNPRHTIKDMLLLKQSRNYKCATTFNYGSGSVVDMAFKTSSAKLAIANVATQDSYNRMGNLLLSDLNNNITKELYGHDLPSQTSGQRMNVTVNDIKLSYSKNFFISGADDHKTMIWDAESGQHLNTIEECTSRVNRIAILEDSQNGQDVFATCSDSGELNMYALNNEGKIEARNKQLHTSSKRSISSLSFGYGFFWDCLAAGLEGLDNGLNNDGLTGQVAFYDANSLAKVAVGDLGFRYVSSENTQRSVSCISFSSTGNLVVCGTSGRTSAGDEEQGDGILRVFDVRRAKVIETATSGHLDVNLAEFSPCEKYIISGCNNNEIAVFDRRHLSKPLHRLRHQQCFDDANAGITSTLWWPSRLGSSQTMLISGGGDGAVKLWDIRRASEDAEIWSFDALLGPIARMVSSDYFESLIVGGDTGAVSVFTVNNGIMSQYEDKPMSLLSRVVDDPEAVEAP